MSQSPLPSLLILLGVAASIACASNEGGSPATSAVCAACQAQGGSRSGQNGGVSGLAAGQGGSPSLPGLSGSPAGSAGQPEVGAAGAAGAAMSAGGNAGTQGIAGTGGAPSRCDQVTGSTAQALVAGGALLLDVRTAAEYAAGHLPGAINIPVTDLPNRLSELDIARPLVVYCQSGGRSASASNTLCAAGHTVHNLGAMANWGT